MSVRRVRVRRERPTAVAMAIALCVTMLVVYALTLDVGGTDAVRSVAAAPRVTRQIELERIEGWCVAMVQCESQQEARLQSSAWVNRGAAGYVAELDGGWAVLGAVYDTEQEAERIARRMREDENIPAEVVCLEADGLTLRITAPEAQIEAIVGADALLRRQADQLGEVALQIDRGEIGADAARTLCALAASEARKASLELSSIPGVGDNALCAGLIGRLDALAELQEAALNSANSGGATLSGMLRCAQLDAFVGHLKLLQGMKG